MKKTGFTKFSLASTAVFILLTIFYFYVGPVFSSGVDAVNLMSPANNTWTNENNDTIEFIFNYTGENETASCTLFINNVAYGTNDSVLNSTPTTIYANHSINEGTINWYVNCTNETTIQSAIWILNVDRTPPIITIQSPLNQIYHENWTWANVSLNENGSWCAFELDSNGTNVTMLNDSMKHFYANVSNLTEGLHNITYWCNDTIGNMGNSTLRYFTIDYPPTTYLHSPENDAWQNESSITFNCSAGDSIQLKNITLYGNWSSGWHANETKNLTGTSNSTNFSKIISDGIYVWNCLAYDNSSGSDFADSNYTLKIDTSGPVINLISPSNNAWDDDGNVTFIYNVSDLSGIKNCSLWITNSTQGNFSQNQSNQTVVTNNALNNITSWKFGDGIYKWNIKCYDILSHAAFSSTNYTLNIGNRSDLIIEDITWTLSPTPYAGENITINVTVKNRGTANVENKTNISLRYGNYFNITEIEASDLTAGASKTITYYAPGNLTVISGSNNVIAVADCNNTETEQSETNNTMTKTISTYLNITILSISPSNTLQGKNITVNVSVKYDNGTAVPGLSLSNFTIYDTYGGSERNRNSYLYQKDFSQNATGIYVFNYTAPAKANGISEHGTHNIKIESKDNSTGYYHDGNSTQSSYIILAPSLSAIFYDYPSSMNTGDTNVFYITISNSGTVPIYNVTILYSSNSSSNLALNRTSCTISNITNGSSVTSCYTKITANAAGRYKVNMTSVWGQAENDGNYNGTGDWFEVTVTTPSNEIPPQQQTCTTNASCPSNKYCLNGVCVLLNCPAGYTISDHKCVPPANMTKVDIIEYPSNIFVIQGESNTSYVKVKNSGTISAVVKMNATFNISGVSISITPSSYTLNAGSTTTFTMKISTENKTEIGEYKVIVTIYDKSVYDQKNITLIIQPTNESKIEINKTYFNYKKMYEELVERFNEINIDAVSLENTTKTNRTYTTLTNMLKQIETYLNSEDYIKANQLLSDFKTILETFEEQIERLKEEERIAIEKKTSETWNWTIITAVIIVAIAVLIYLLLPPKKEEGYHPQKGYTPPQPKKGGLFGLFKKKPKQKSIVDFEKKTEVKPAQTETYKKGYEKLKTIEYDHEKRKKQ